MEIINYAYKMRIINVLVIANPLNIRQSVKYTFNQHPHFSVKDIAHDEPEKILKIIKQFEIDVVLIHVNFLELETSTIEIDFLVEQSPIPVILLTQEASLYPDELHQIEQYEIYQLIDLPEKAYDKSNVPPCIIHNLAKTATNAAYARKQRKDSYFYKQNQGLTREIDKNKSTSIKTTPAKCHDPIIAIGSSTGGVVIVEKIIKYLPIDIPPVVITQHIPPVFSQSFAQRLDEKYPLNVYEARQDQVLETGSVYIAPGDWHLEVICQNELYVCRLSQSERVNSHRPSADVMFDSIIKLDTADAIGIILTGMGNDGVQALLRMRDKGLMTIAQDKRSSLIWGMPGEAVKQGAASEVLAPEEIANYLSYRFGSS